jgi:hypothetical protein
MSVKVATFIRQTDIKSQIVVLEVITHYSLEDDNPEDDV